MTTYKRINGDYTIQTLNTGDEITITTSNVQVNGNLAVSGNLSAALVTASFFIGDGQFLSNVTANIGSASILQNGTSNVNIPVTNGNITFGVNSVGNVIVVSALGANITTGTVSTSNVTGALKVSGGVGVQGNVYADAVYSNNAAVLTANSVINGGTY
jgi:hypothetical protein